MGGAPRNPKSFGVATSPRPKEAAVTAERTASRPGPASKEHYLSVGTGVYYGWRTRTPKGDRYVAVGAPLQVVAVVDDSFYLTTGLDVSIGQNVQLGRSPFGLTGELGLGASFVLEEDTLLPIVRPMGGMYVDASDSNRFSVLVGMDGGFLVYEYVGLTAALRWEHAL